MALLNPIKLNRSETVIENINGQGRFTLRVYQLLEGIIDNLNVFINGNYLESGDNVSELVNDAGYLVTGDNVSELFNDVPYALDTTTVTVVSTAIDYTQVNINERVFVDASSGDVTVTLLAAATGKYCDVVKEDSSTNSVIIASADNVNGDATQSLLYQYESAECGSSGTEWIVI